MAVSGDLTQRARREEFKQARAFLDALSRVYADEPGAAPAAASSSLILP